MFVAVVERKKEKQRYKMKNMGKFFPYSFVNEPHHVLKNSKNVSQVKTIALWFPCRNYVQKTRERDIMLQLQRIGMQERRVVHFKYSLVVLIGHKMVTLWPLPADTMSGKILYI